MNKFPQLLTKKLEQRQQENSLRTLPVHNDLVDFSSNDYLGLSKSAAIFNQAHQYLMQNNIVGNGATGSRLISGSHSLYQIAEGYIAEFHHAESALMFNSGYDANVGLFSSLPQKDDVVLYDEYIHASIRDGIRLSNARAYKFKHNDTADLEKLIMRHKNERGEIYIAIESVFSMDGDCAPLQTMVDLSEKHECRLIVDEAHALGIVGEKGEGMVQDLGLQDIVFARLITFGKGLGCHGAAVLGAKELTDYLVNFARSFIYTTALPQHSLATILTAYQYLNSEGAAGVKVLKHIVSFFTSEIKKHNLENIFINSTSAIHCAIVPGNEKVKNISSVLQQHGYNVKPILSPTVPQGSERLRLCLHTYNTKDEIKGLITALYKALQ